jgi:biotin carboxylase
MVEGDSRSGGPRLLVIGGGPAQLGLLEAARARGVWLAVVDRDPRAPGLRLADRRCLVSTEDEPGIERLAAALGVEGIVSPGTDWPVAIAARVAQRLGLPHPLSPETALLATNKLRQRERLADAGVPQPRSWVVGPADPLPRIDAPCVVKAPDRQGQQGLSLVERGADLARAVELARGAARSGVILVEELVAGPEVTVVGFSARGLFSPLVVTDRLVARPPAFGVALAHVFPSPHAAAAAGAAALALEALGIAEGPSYTQLRIDAEGPKVIEVAARLGGGHDAELVEAAVGIPLNDLTVDAALGRGPATPPPPGRTPGGATTRFLVAPPGALEGVEVPERLEGVLRVRIYRERGHVFGPLRRGADRAGALLAVGATREEAVARADAAAERIRFATADAGAVVQAH